MSLNKTTLGGIDARKAANESRLWMRAVVLTLSAIGSGAIAREEEEYVGRDAGE